MLTFNRPVQQELCPPPNHHHPMMQKFLNQFLERQNTRFSVDQSQQDNGKRVLKRGKLIKLIQNNFRIRIPFQFQDQPNRFFQIRLIPNPGNANNFPLVDHFRDFFLNAIPRLLERDFRNDNPVFFAKLFNSRSCPDRNISPSCQVSTTYTAGAADNAAGREVRARTDAKQFIRRNIRIVNHRDRRVTYFVDIMRRNTRCHTNRDSIRPVNQQIRGLGRQNRWLHAPFIISRDKINGVHIQVFKQCRRHSGKSRFRVTHGSGGQTGNRPEVSLLVDQHVAHVPFLRHTNQRRVDDLLPMGMIITTRIPGNLRAFDPAGARSQINVVHRDKDTSLRWL